MVFAKPQKAGCSLGLRSKRFVHHGWVAYGAKKHFAEISESIKKTIRKHFKSSASRIKSVE